MNYVKIAEESFVLIPLAAIIINNILPTRIAVKYFHVITGLVALIQMTAAGYAFAIMNKAHENTMEFALFWDKVTGKSEYFALNITGVFFLFCIGMVAFVSVMIGIKTVDIKKNSYVNLLMTLLIGMNGMVLSKDLFTLYVFLEIVGITSFVMIAMFRSRKGLEGSIKYLIISELATIFILSGFSMIFLKTGSLTYADVTAMMADNIDGHRNVLMYSAVILMTAGFAVKAGIVPFHSWLPDAHQSADTSISVLLSGIVIKIAGIYGFVVIVDLFGELKPLRITLAILGLLSVVTGALLAMRQSHFKRVIAYSSVSQMGYILLGLSAGTTLGLIGAFAHIFSHAVFKSTLFTNAAAIHEQTGTLEMDEMGGLQSRMPVTAFSSVIAFLSTAGVPPFCGFWSKLLIIMALWISGNEVLAGFALCASILTGAYFLRMQKKVFFGKTPDSMAGVTEISGSIKFIEIVLTAITSAAGLLFPLVLLFLQSRGLI